MTITTRRRSRLLSALGATALVVALGYVTAAPAYASTFVATDAASLSAAITAANASAGTDIIQIQPSVGNTITMTAGNPQVTGPIIVTGDAANPPTIVGPTTAEPIFQVTDPTADIEIDKVIMQGTATGGSAITFVSSSGDVTFTGDTFTNFVHPAVELLLHSGDLTITNCRFNDDSSMAADADGGAVTAGAVHNVSITGSTFSDNLAGHHGGAVFLGNANSIDISTTTFTGNRAGDDGAAVEISSLAADSTWTNDTFTSNWVGSSAAVGGAAFLVTTVDAGVAFVIDRSTFSGNAALTGGVPTRGAVGYVNDVEGTLQLTNSTMTGNGFDSGSNGLGIDLAVGIIGDTGEFDVMQATLDEAGPADGLLFIGSNNHRAQLASSTFFGPGVLLASNSNPAADAIESHNIIVISTTATPAFDVTGTPAVIGYSITSDAAGAQLVDLGGTQFSVADPMLAPLANNGGPTQTRLPLAGSLAINTGDPGFATPPTTDQRGTGFARVVNGRVDIGAIEVQATTAPTLSATGVDPASSVWTASTSLALGLLLVGSVLLLRRARRNTAK